MLRKEKLKSEPTARKQMLQNLFYSCSTYTNQLVLRMKAK